MQNIIYKGGAFNNARESHTAKRLAVFYELTHNSLKYLEWNLVQEKLDGFFPQLKDAILSFGKCLNY